MLPLFIIATLCLLAVGEDSDGRACLKIGQITECTCHRETVYYSVHCSFVRSVAQLKQILDIAKEGKSMHLEFYGMYPKEIPFDIFEGVDIETLQFESSKIISFGDHKPFSGLEKSLKKLVFYGAMDKKKADVNTGRNNATLSHLKALDTLRVEHEGLRIVPDIWYVDGPEGLSSLSFDNNKIAVLGDNLFAPLSNISHIYLFNNRISTLKRSMFPKPAEHLLWLDLSLNRITDLPSDMFSDMPNLTHLNLNSNYLMTLNQATFKGILSNNDEIDVLLEGNFMHCDEKIKWICESGVEKRLRGKCALPHHLTGKRLKSLTLWDFDDSDED